MSRLSINRRAVLATLASVPGLRGMTAVLDAARDRLFATGVAKGLASVLTVSLERGAVRPVVPNEMEGITFGGYAVTADGRLVFMKKETNYDVWMFDFAGPNRAGTSQGGSK